MRRVIGVPLLMLGSFLLVHCSNDAPPEARVRNLRADKANISWKDDSGNTTNITGVDPGVTTAYEMVRNGPYNVTGSVQNEANPAPTSFSAYNGRKYTVVVVDTGATPSLRVVSP